MDADKIGWFGIGLVPESRLIFLNRVRENLVAWPSNHIGEAAPWTLQRIFEFFPLLIDKYVRSLVKIAHRHYIIERGRVHWQGSSQQLGADQTLWHRYLGL